MHFGFIIPLFLQSFAKYLPLKEHYANVTRNTEIDKNRPHHRGDNLLADIPMSITVNQNRIKFILIYT